jgi:hypothetical protein
MSWQFYERLLDQLSKTPPDARTDLLTLLICRTVVDLAYTVMLAIVVWALGRRLLQALLAAWRESRRATSA